MNKKERVLAALSGRLPDRVPYMYNVISPSVQRDIIGEAVVTPVVDNAHVSGWLGAVGEEPVVTPLLTCDPAVAAKLNLDAIGIQVLPPLFVHTVVHDGVPAIAAGQLSDREALKKIVMPDPDDERLLNEIAKMIDKYKNGFAMYARVRLGAAPVIQSMGIDHLAYALADAPDFLEEVVALYTNWGEALFRNLSELDFDFFWCFDDIAYEQSMLISPSVFRQYLKAPMQKAASAIKQPFIFHSDGNIAKVLDDILEMGASGLHPMEPGSMDGDWLKSTYGDRLCLIGNIDLDRILMNGTPELAEAAVKERILQFGKNGRYILSDSNSVPDGCVGRNVIAVSEAVEKYGYIY